jgi:maltose O-acetyltransferase
MPSNFARFSNLARCSFASTTRRILVNSVGASTLVPTSLRWKLLRKAGIEASPSRIASKNFFGGSNIQIGRGAFINRECLFDASARIVIDSHVSVGMRVMFITSSHLSDDPSRRAGAVISEPIHVGSGVWIGAGATILPGVSIGEGAIVAAGAVVNRDCLPHTLYAGVPARAVRSFSTYETTS